MIAAINPDLTWHFSAGTSAQHRLTVTSGGVAAARPSAERWYRAAPPPDETWEFRPAQEADPEALTGALDMAGHKIDLPLLRFRVEPAAEQFRVHLGVYHPLFVTMPGPETQQVSYLVLDWLLGEDDVERWVGRIETLQTPPIPAATGSDLIEAVAGMAASRAPDEWSLAEWSLAEWSDESGRPGIAAFRRGVRWLDYPASDRHHVIVAPYRSQQNGLPADNAALDLLRETEATMEHALGGRGVLVAHESHSGLRTFHVYTDSEDQNVDDALQTWAKSAKVRLTASMDPAWSEVRRFTG